MHSHCVSRAGIPTAIPQQEVVQFRWHGQTLALGTLDRMLSQPASHLRRFLKASLLILHFKAWLFFFFLCL